MINHLQMSRHLCWGHVCTCQGGKDEFWVSGGKTSDLHKTEGVNTHHRRLHILIQIEEKSDKKQNLQGGIVLFAVPMSSPAPSLGKVTFTEDILIHTQAWGYSSLLMGHNSHSCADMRGSCHVSEGAINHQSPPKVPHTHFWGLPPDDCPWVHSVTTESQCYKGSIKFPPAQERYLGEVPTSKCLLTHWTLFFFWPTLNPDRQRLWSSPQPMDINQVSLLDLQVVTSFHPFPFFPFLSFPHTFSWVSFLCFCISISL